MIDKFQSWFVRVSEVNNLLVVLNSATNFIVYMRCRQKALKKTSSGKTTNVAGGNFINAPFSSRGENFPSLVKLMKNVTRILMRCCECDA